MAVKLIPELVQRAKMEICEEEYGQDHKVPCVQQCNNGECLGRNGCSDLPGDVLSKITYRYNVLKRSQ